MFILFRLDSTCTFASSFLFDIVISISPHINILPHPKFHIIITYDYNKYHLHK